MTLISDQTYTVPERASNVTTNFNVKDGDKLLLEAWGTIWAGVWFTGRNGPDGWSPPSEDPKFPLVGAHTYSLLGRLGGRYLEIGWGLEYNWLPGNGLSTPLSLRTNDDWPGNGNGSFYCRIRQYRS